MGVGNSGESIDMIALNSLVCLHRSNMRASKGRVADVIGWLAGRLKAVNGVDLSAIPSGSTTTVTVYIDVLWKSRAAVNLCQLYHGQKPVVPV